MQAFTDAKSVLQELRAIVPELPNAPVQPVIIGSQDEPGMFDFFRHFPWFLPLHRYNTEAQLLSELSERSVHAAYQQTRYAAPVTCKGSGP